MKKIKTAFYSLFALLALAAVALFVVFEVNDVEVKSMNEEARRGADGQFIALPDGVTHYEASGSDTAKTIILVHGFSVPYYIWNGTYDSLTRQGFHVVRYDEYGRGYSDRPDVIYSPAFYRKQLFDLINALKLKTPVSLAGVSFGGGVVADFAVHYPSLVDKIVLVDPVFRFRKAGASAAVINFYMAINHEKQASGQVDDFKYPDRFPGWVERYKKQMAYQGFRHALVSTLMHYSGDTIIANYHQLDLLHKKILLIWGKEDQTVTYNFSDSMRKILTVDFLPVDDARHLPQLEQPLLVNQRIVSFLK
jgi:pimeloyl-ACP methyl ester carboxylesterase